MAQQKQVFSRKNDVLTAIPKASTDISSGDLVMLAIKSDPVSRAFCTVDRIMPVASVLQCKWAVGVAENSFTSAIVGATKYATPDSSVAVVVRRKGIVKLAVSDTSGKMGDAVIYSSGATGAQVFAIDNSRPGMAIGRIAKSFSGATANDVQDVELSEKVIGAPDIYWWMENRVLEGCYVTVATQPASRVKVGLTQTTVTKINRVIIGNKVFSLASNKSLALGGVASCGASDIRFKYVVARSGSFGIRSCSGTKTALASYTVAGVTAGMFVPVTMTAAEIPIALLIQFSASTQSLARIKQIRGVGAIPKVGSWGL